MALVVNGDDFGMSESVNAAIAEAFEKGLIDRTTLMANMPAAAEAMDLARRCGFADRVGIHLNLTSGKPLTPDIGKDRLMCDDNGEFTADFARKLTTRFCLPKHTKDSVEAEIRAQFDRYKELGGTLWHIDSHHHVHTDPSVWQILRKIIKDYPVTGVRLSRNMYAGGNPLMRIYKKMFNRKACRIGTLHPEYFGSAADYAAFTANRPELSRISEVEVMVHPVYDPSGELSDVSRGVFGKLERLH